MLIKEQCTRIREKPFELAVLSLIVIVIVLTSMTITPMLRRLNAPVDAFLEEQNVESFHVSLGMIDFNHLSGAQRLDVYNTMDLYAEFPALDENNPYQMNAINQYIQTHIYHYPDLVERIYASVITPFQTDQVHYELSYRFALDDGDFHYQVLTVNQTLNRPYFTDGNAPNTGQVALFHPFGIANQLDVGDAFIIHGKTFEISGFFYSPQFILPALQTTSLTYDAHTESYVLVDFETFLQFEEPFKVYYQGSGDFESIQGDFDVYQIMQSDVQRLGRNMRMVETVVPQEYNLRIQAVSTESGVTSTFVNGFSILFYLLSFVLIGYAIKNHLDKQKLMFLTLYALGYSRAKLARSQLVIAAYFSFLLIVFGFIGLYLSDFFYRFYTARYFYPHDSFRVDGLVFVFGIALPVLVMMGGTYGYSYSVIKRFSREKTMTHARMRMHQVRKFMGRGLLFVGVATLFLFSRFTADLIDDFQSQTLEGKHFEQMVFLKNHTPSVDPEHEPFVYGFVEIQAINAQTITSRTYVQGYGIPYDTTLLRFSESMETQNNLLEHGVLVSEHFANSYNITIGDELLLGIGRNQVRLPVTEITSELIESALYMNHETFNALQGYSDQPMVNGYFTSKVIESDADAFRIIHYSVVVEEINQLFQLTNRVLYGLMVISVLVAFLMFYYLINAALDRVLPTFLTLKALGYTSKETYRVFFRDNFLILGASYVLACLVSIFMITRMLHMLYRDFGFVFVFNFSVFTVIIGFLVMSLFIGFVSYLSHVRIQKVPLSTALKKV